MYTASAQASLGVTLRMFVPDRTRSGVARNILMSAATLPFLVHDTHWPRSTMSSLHCPIACAHIAVTPERLCALLNEIMSKPVLVPSPHSDSRPWSRCSHVTHITHRSGQIGPRLRLCVQLVTQGSHAQRPSVQDLPHRCVLSSSTQTPRSGF